MGVMQGTRKDREVTEVLLVGFWLQRATHNIYSNASLF